MFVVLLSYRKSFAEVDRYLTEHRAFLERGYAAGYFLLSGRKEPRTGGVILARASSRLELEAILRSDPFHREQIAEYEIVQFVPSMASAPLAQLVEV